MEKPLEQYQKEELIEKLKKDDYYVMKDCVDFATEQDFKIYQVWKEDPNFEKTSLDFLVEEEIDVFKNETRFSTFRSREFDFPYYYPINFLYISRPEGEQFYVQFVGSEEIAYNGSIIFNINGKTNVVLKIDDTDELLEGKSSEEIRIDSFYEFYNDDKEPDCDIGWHDEYVSTLPISKEDFLKCCYAEHLKVRVNTDASTIYWEGDCDELISIAQIFYNRVCDSSMFVENKDQWRIEIGKKFDEKLSKGLPQREANREASRAEDKKDTRKFVGRVLLILLIILGGIASLMIPLFFML